MLALLLLLIKGALVLSLGEVFFFGEEYAKATAAKAMIDGLDVPHYQLAYHYYEGGGFVVSHFVALAFLLVGQNLLALKLVALGFQLAILVTGYGLTKRLFGSTAGLAFGLFFILGPVSYQKLSLICLGIHFEACLFMVGTLFLGARILLLGKSDSRDWFFLGLVTGFGIYFSYMVALAALWVALLLVGLRWRQLFGVRGAWAIFGTFLGLVPWIWMYSLVGKELFDIHGVRLTDAPSFYENWVLFCEALASIFTTAEGGPRATPWIRLGIFLIALVVLARRKAAGYVLGYMALFLGVYLSSP